MTTAEAVPSGEIRSVLVPLSGIQILLPSSTIAEVVNYHPPQAIDGAPRWLKGYLAWRGEIIPLVALEPLMGLVENLPGHRARIAVCNTLGGNSRLPYIAVVAQSIPHLVRVTGASISAVREGQAANPLVLEKVLVQGEDALIPDLDALEQKIVETLGY